MNSKLLIGLVLLLGVGGVGAFVAMKGITSTPAPLTATPATSGEPTSGSSMQTMRDFLVGGKTVSCTFPDGEMFVANGKVRTDISTTAGGTSTVMHMIVDGNTAYNWTEGQTTGFKLAYSASAGASSSNTGSGQTVDVDKKMDFNCQPWNGDSSKFTLPTSVTFTDTSALTGSAKVSGSAGAGASTKAAQCATCDFLSGDEQAQCKSAMGC